jgi:hypothetical protein
MNLKMNLKMKMKMNVKMNLNKKMNTKMNTNLKRKLNVDDVDVDDPEHEREWSPVEKEAFHCTG